MATKITVTPAEQGTAKVAISDFTDESGASVTPTAIAWTLTDRSGNVINSRSAVSVTPAASVEFLLAGDDLAIGTNGAERALMLAATYDSSLGTGLVARMQAYFSIEKFISVAD